jgi:hypothetical protein
MISERLFSTAYTSFWTEETPFAESFIRNMNLGLERFKPPMVSKAPASFNGFINELGFRIAEYAFTLGSNKGDTAIADILYSETKEYIRKLPRPSIPGSKEERSVAVNDAVIIGNRLLSIISDLKSGRQLLFRPRFNGCGIHDDCEGDILIGKELWEVKSGDRPFRQPDIRQVLVYCALNHNSGQYVITDYRLVNPREGVMYYGPLRDLVRPIAGCEPETLYGDIIEFISRSEVSV